MMEDGFWHMKRILVVGCPGSGKSTFAKKLHEYTGLPLTHLDNVWWKEDRTHITREEFDRRLQALLQGGAWILDGDYSRTYEARIRAADTVIFLDFAEEECLNGVLSRLGTRRTDIPWTEDRPDPELIRRVRAYREENRPKLYDLFGQYPDKNLLVFHTRAEADAWLDGLTKSDPEGSLSSVKE